MNEDRAGGITNQVFGLGLMTATAVLMLAVTVFLIDPAESATAAVLSIVLGGVTYIVWRFEKMWATILGLFVAVAAAVTVFYIAFGIVQIFSPIEFVAGLLLIIGFFFAFFGGVGAITRHLRHSKPGGTRLRRGALMLIGLGALVSMVGFLFTRSTVDPTEVSGAASIDMRDFLFEPEEISIAVGQSLLFTNSDAFAHDFTLEEYDLYTYFGPGSEALVDVSELPPGTYTYFCSLHSFDGEGMIGTLTIEG